MPGSRKRRSTQGSEAESSDDERTRLRVASPSIRSGEEVAESPQTGDPEGSRERQTPRGALTGEARKNGSNQKRADRKKKEVDETGAANMIRDPNADGTPRLPRSLKTESYAHSRRI